MHKVRDMSGSRARPPAEAGSHWMPVAPPVHPESDDGSHHSLRQTSTSALPPEGKIVNEPPVSSFHCFVTTQLLPVCHVGLCPSAAQDLPSQTAPNHPLHLPSMLCASAHPQVSKPHSLFKAHLKCHVCYEAFF